MIIDMKYHIVSLVAVFSALGLGILIGTSMVGNDALINMQKQLTDRLEQKYDTLLKENKETQAQIGQLETDARTAQEFAQETFPALVGGRLTGLQIAIVETSNLTNHEEFFDILKLAGVKITSVTTFLGELDLENQQKINDVKLKLGIEGNNIEDILGAVSNQIFTGVTTGKNQEQLQYLQTQNILKTSGEYGIPVNGVILIGGSLTTEEMFAQFLDEPMVRSFTQSAIPVYGVETIDVPISYMKAYQKMKITTVDNIDTIPGQVALVYALQNHPGNYGVKKTAKRLLPVLP